MLQLLQHKNSAIKHLTNLLLYFFMKRCFSETFRNLFRYVFYKNAQNTEQLHFSGQVYSEKIYFGKILKFLALKTFFLDTHTTILSENMSLKK